MAHSHDKSRRHDHEGHVHDHSHSEDGHSELSHSHGVVDPSILTSERGIWAIKWSFVGLLITALFQVVVVLAIRSVALLADTIHNFANTRGIAGLPLRLRAPEAEQEVHLRLRRVAGRHQYRRHHCAQRGICRIRSRATAAQPKPIGYLWRVAATSIRLFGNEAVALFRIRVGDPQRRSDCRRLSRLRGWPNQSGGARRSCWRVARLSAGGPDRWIAHYACHSADRVPVEQGRFHRAFDGIEPEIVDEIRVSLLMRAALKR